MGISAPSANVDRIGRLANARPGQIDCWCRQLKRAGHGFAQVQVQLDPDPIPAAEIAITVEFERATVRIAGRRVAGSGCSATAMGEAVIPVPSGVWVWTTTGHTDMRPGMRTLALQAHQLILRG